MPILDYAPQRISAEELNSAVELDTEFIVNPDGTAELSGGFAPAVTGHQGPVDPTIENDPEHWEFFSRGYTGQYGYHGPEMHSSEYLGGDLAHDILASPGTYALVAVRYDHDEDCEPDCQDDHLESWAVLKRRDDESDHEEKPS